MRMGGPTSSESSSGEEDGDAEWKAAIQSIASTTPFAINGFNNSSSGSSAAITSTKPNSNPTPSTEDDAELQNQPKKLKSYQIKTQKLLNGLLEKTLSFVKETSFVAENEPEEEKDSGVRLFRDSPQGIVFDRVGYQEPPRKKPKILPRRVDDEKPEKLRQQLRSVVVDGNDILAAAQAANEKALARLRAKEEAAKEKAKREEERVAELKKIRGERWLPSLAKEMKVAKKFEAWKQRMQQQQQQSCFPK